MDSLHHTPVLKKKTVKFRSLTPTHGSPGALSLPLRGPNSTPTASGTAPHYMPSMLEAGGGGGRSNPSLNVSAGGGAVCPGSTAHRHPRLPAALHRHPPPQAPRP